MPRGGNPFHTAKQSHQIRNLNVFERMHGIFDLAARPFVGVTGREARGLATVRGVVARRTTRDDVGSAGALSLSPATSRPW